MNLNQLRFVRAVVDAGTFTAAAEQCFVTQSTLSTGVALLEKELGAKLFVRTTRSVSLTPFGRGLLPRIDKILAAHSELQRAAEELAGADAEVVRLGVCPLVDSRRLEEVLRPYRDANRNVRVVLEQLDGVEPKVVLDEGRFHFVIGPSETRRRPLERALLYEDPLVYVAGAGAGCRRSRPTPSSSSTRRAGSPCSPASCSSPAGWRCTSTRAGASASRCSRSGPPWGWDRPSSPGRRCRHRTRPGPSCSATAIPPPSASTRCGRRPPSGRLTWRPWPASSRRRRGTRPARCERSGLSGPV
jgi:DNA-binding transcriptional LysR family regulator